jgi:fatty-acyl-CoA synthase
MYVPLNWRLSAGEIIISGGENVYPAEIENVLAGFPHLAECAVVGVAMPNQIINQPEVALFLESRLARYKIPKHMSSMTALPRNAAGKISKKVLRSMLGTEVSGSPWPDVSSIRFRYPCAPS